MTKKIPEGFHTLTPSLTIKGAARAIDLYKKAFGAEEIACMKIPGSDKIVHAVLKIGNSHIFINDVIPGMAAKPAATSFYVYLDNVEAAHKRAVDSGLKSTMQPEDMFWGDRTSSVQDPFGIHWTLATHVRDVSEEEMEKGAREMFSKKAA